MRAPTLLGESRHSMVMHGLGFPSFRYSPRARALVFTASIDSSQRLQDGEEQAHHPQAAADDEQLFSCVCELTGGVPQPLRRFPLNAHAQGESLTLECLSAELFCGPTSERARVLVAGLLGDLLVWDLAEDGQSEPVRLRTGVSHCEAVHLEACDSFALIAVGAVAQGGASTLQLINLSDPQRPRRVWSDTSIHRQALCSLDFCESLGLLCSCDEEKIVISDLRSSPPTQLHCISRCATAPCRSLELPNAARTVAGEHVQETQERDEEDGEEDEEEDEEEEEDEDEDDRNGGEAGRSDCDKGGALMLPSGVLLEWGSRAIGDGAIRLWGTSASLPSRTSSPISITDPSSLARPHGALQPAKTRR